MNQSFLTFRRPIEGLVVASRFLQALVCLLCVQSAWAADANPPQGMTYQGFLTDSNGTVLGNTAPANYDTVFRIWSVKEGGDSSALLWSEQQTVTVDKGYFSVLLGEGSIVGSEPKGALPQVFHANDASDRFIEITVKGLSGGDVTLAPRIKLVSSPFSFLSSHSRTSDRLVGTNSSNQTVDVIKTSGENVGLGLASGASPNARLDVNGSTRLRTTLSVGGQSNLEGQVAIGKTTVPNATLDVNGTAKVSGRMTLDSDLTLTNGSLQITPFGLTPALVINHPGSPSYALQFDMTGDKTWIRNTSSTTSLSLGANNRESLIIDPNGSVSTSGFFHVKGTDLTLGTGGGRSVGNRTGQRAMVHLDGDVLNINYGTDFEGGTTISGDARVTGNLTTQNSLYFNKLLQNSTDSSFPAIILDSTSGGNDWTDQGAQVRIGEQASSNGAAQMSMAYTGNGWGLVGAGQTSRDATSGSHLEMYYQPNTWAYLSNTYGLRIVHSDTKRDIHVGPYDHGFYIGANDTYHHRNSWRYAYYDGDSNWDFGSDVRMKKDIKDAESMMDRLMQVQIRRFKWRDGQEDQKWDLGVIAQEIEPLFPELVGQTEVKPTIPYAEGEMDEPMKTVGYTSFGVLAVKGLQELKAEKDAEIQSLREALIERDKRIEQLEANQSKIIELEERLSALTALLKP